MATFRKSLFLSLFFIALSVSLNSCEVVKERIGLGGPKDIPLGEYIGTAEPISNKDEEAGKEVKISFLPKESGLQDAVGVLIFDNNSDRFLWRSDGNNKNIWNIMFTKDNTIYSNIRESFEFSGVIKSSDTRNTLEGKFSKIAEDEETIYYFKAAQVHKPELEKPKEDIAVKAGEEVSISLSKVDPEKVKIYMQALEGTDARNKVMQITKSSSEKGKHSISFSSSKDQNKGKYRIYAEREDGEKTKSIIIELQ